MRPIDIEIHVVVPEGTDPAEVARHIEAHRAEFSSQCHTAVSEALSNPRQHMLAERLARLERETRLLMDSHRDALWLGFDYGLSIGCTLALFAALIAATAGFLWACALVPLAALVRWATKRLVDRSFRQ